MLVARIMKTIMLGELFILNTHAEIWRRSANLLGETDGTYVRGALYQ